MHSLSDASAIKSTTSFDQEQRDGCCENTTKELMSRKRLTTTTTTTLQRLCVLKQIFGDQREIIKYPILCVLALNCLLYKMVFTLEHLAQQ